MKAIFAVLFGGILIINQVSGIYLNTLSHGKQSNLEIGELEKIELQAQLDQDKVGGDQEDTSNVDAKEDEPKKTKLSITAIVQKDALEEADILKKEKELKQKSQNMTNTQAGVGIDIANWINDNKYFNRIFNQYQMTQTRSDGQEMSEKVIAKEDAEKAVRQILVEKLDDSNNQKTSDNVQRLMSKFFSENWEYADAANEGTIEVSRAPAFFHRIVNQIKMDDEEESLLWKV